MSEIVRTKTEVRGGVTPEEEVKLKEHAEKWKKIIMRTEPIDRELITKCIHKLYEVSGLEKPTVYIVSSPLGMAIMGGVEAARCHLQGGGGEYDAQKFNQAAEVVAVSTRLRERVKGWDEELVKFIGGCVKNWWRMLQGGNMWSQWDCYLTAWRDVMGLDLPIYEKYKAWEDCAIHGGMRIVHEKFCVVTDFPEFIKMDDQNRSHCDDGPSHRWRDGWSLWHIHGVMLTKQIVEAPHTLTIEQIDKEPNAEVRRIMIDRFGKERFVLESCADPVHQDEWGILYKRELAGDEPVTMVKVINSTEERDGTYKDYWMRVHPELRPMLPGGGFGDPQELTAKNAVASTFGMTGSEYLLQLET